MNKKENFIEKRIEFVSFIFVDITFQNPTLCAVC